MKYDAFISYSHAADGRLAPALQKALHQLARPTFKLRALHIFRDETSLSATPHLWGKIEEALRKSEYLILLASPQSARSQWVAKEIDFWLEHKSIDTLLIGLTEGEISWSDTSEDPDWEKTNALPKRLQGQVKMEPLYVDFKSFKTEEDLDLNNHYFKKEVAKLAATIHGKTVDDLIGEDVRQFKRTIRLRNGALAILTILLVLSLLTTWWALDRQSFAEVQQQIAQDSAQVAQDQRRIAQDSARSARFQRQIARDSAAVARHQRKIAQDLAIAEQKARRDVERSLADGLAFKARRFIEEKRYGAATALLAKAKSLFPSTEVFVTSLQVPTSMVLPNTIAKTSFEGWRDMKVDQKGNLALGIDQENQLVFWSALNKTAGRIPNSKFVREKAFDIFHPQLSFFCITPAGDVFTIDSLGQVNLLHSLEGDFESLDVRYSGVLPSTNQLLVARHDGMIQVLEENSVTTLPISMPDSAFGLEDVAVDTSNQRFIVAWSGGEIISYDLKNWKPIDSFNINDWNGQNEDLTYHPQLLLGDLSRHLLVVSSGGDLSEPFLLDLTRDTFQIRKVDLGEDAYLPANDLIKFQPNETQFAIANRSVLHIFLTGSLERVHSIQAEGEVNTFAYTKNGKYILLPYRQNMLGIFSSETGELVELVEGFREKITDIALSKDGLSVFVTMQDGTVKTLWFYKIPDVYAFNNEAQIIAPSAILNPTGSLAAVPLPLLPTENGQLIALFDGRNGDILHLLEDAAIPNSKNKIDFLSFSADSRFLLAFSTANGIAIWSLQNEPRLIVPWQKTGFSTVSDVFFSGGPTPNVIVIPDNHQSSAMLYAIEGGRLKNKQNISAGDFLDLAIATSLTKIIREAPPMIDKRRNLINQFRHLRNGKIVLFASKDLIIWDPATGKTQMRSYKSSWGLKSRVFAFSSDEKYLASIIHRAKDLSIEIFDIESGQSFQVENPSQNFYDQPFHQNFGLLDIAFSKDNQSIITLSQKNVIQSWGAFVPQSDDEATLLTGLKVMGTEVLAAEN